MIILAGRAEKGDDGAKTALFSLLALLGESAVEKARTRKSERDVGNRFRPPEQALPLPADFPPDRFKEYLSSARKVFQREECTKQWVDYWAKQQPGEAYSAIEEAAEQGIQGIGSDAVFGLALSLHGRSGAYHWLVKAHVEHYGWHDFSEAQCRFEVIKRLYPEKWLSFIQDTTVREWREPWRYPTSQDWIAKLIEYLLFLGKTELAKQASERIITGTLELVSPVALPTVEWASRA
jgi:hypothetical protein